MATERELKRLLADFDLSNVFVAQLGGRGLASLECVGRLCVNLLVLDVSHNDIASLAPLTSLACLRRLDAYGNRLSTLCDFSSASLQVGSTHVTSL